MDEEKSDFVSKNLFYAAVIIISIFTFIALVISIFSLFNSGTQGPQGPSGPQGIQGMKGNDGSPCKCSCVLPNNGTIIVDNYLNTQQRVSNCSAISNFISNLSQDDINLILNSKDSDNFTKELKSAIIKYVNTGNTLNCNLNISKIQNWLAEHKNTNFYESVFEDNINLSSINLNDKNMNYFVSVLSSSGEYQNLPKSKFVSLSNQDKIDFLISLLNEYGIDNEKLTEIILYEILSISKNGNVNLDQLNNIEIPQNFQKMIFGVQDKNDKIYISDLKVEGNKNHIYEGKSRRNKIIDLIINANRNYHFNFENKGEKVTIRLVIKNANKLETENGSEEDLYVKPRESRRIIIDNRNARVEN